jgi:hypothetical protein
MQSDLQPALQYNFVPLLLLQGHRPLEVLSALKIRPLLVVILDIAWHLS